MGACQARVRRGSWPARMEAFVAPNRGGRLPPWRGAGHASRRGARCAPLRRGGLPARAEALSASDRVGWLPLSRGVSNVTPQWGVPGFRNPFYALFAAFLEIRFPHFGGADRYLPSLEHTPLRHPVRPQNSHPFQSLRGYLGYMQSNHSGQKKLGVGLCIIHTLGLWVPGGADPVGDGKTGYL